ncbi:MAG: glycogen synthase GlgA [Bacteroidota bacterium]
MKRKLNIVMIASECVPYVKTGGLADVVGALPKALKKMGHEVCIILPYYRSIDRSKYEISQYHAPMGVWMGANTQEWCAVNKTETEDGVPVYFIEHDRFFARDRPYNDSNNRDYLDNAERFAFFSRAALQLCIDKNIQADILHAHDWPTALVPAYHKLWHWNSSVLSKAASVLTIHNIDHQGLFGRDHYEYTGLGWENFTSEKFEQYNGINYLKGGIYFADLVNTVSPTYAVETRSTELGRGMQTPLNSKGEYYLGILNGVDYTEWSPEKDPHLPAKYSTRSMKGKAKCKAALQERFGLKVDPKIPIVGIVSRFAGQKGLDVLYPVIHEAQRQMEIQFVVVGSGDKQLEAQYMALPNRYPGKVGSFIGYSNPLAHLVEAGSDFFVMPSRFEPCGLNQLYSLRYGTLPIVRSTGGLADTVEQYNEQTGEGTGFLFKDLSVGALFNTIGWAVSTWYDRPKHIKAMIKRGMAQRFDWDRSVAVYEEWYHRVVRP